MAAYHQTLLKGVFLFDDKGLVLDNSFIKSFSYLKDIFTTQLFHGSGIYSNFYRPIQSLSLMLDYHLWELNPFGYHLASVLIHIFNALAIYFLVYLVSKKQDAAAIAGLLFCVHTVLTWPVNYVASRADILSTFFFLISVILYILYKQLTVNRRSFLLFISSVVCFILAILTKEATMLLPFVLLLYLRCFPKKQNQSEKTTPNLIWVFFLIIAIYALLRVTVLNFTEGKFMETTTGQLPLYLRLLTTSKVFMLYLRLLFLPIGLHMEWDIEPARSFFQDEVFLSMVGLFIIACFSYAVSRRSKLKFFCIAWFLVTILPYSNILPLNYFMGEGWLYLPSIGFLALMAIYFSELRKRSRVYSFLVIFIVISLTVFYGLLTVRRADVWADPVRLYSEILRYSPNNTKARINLGVLLAEAGSYEEAERRYKEAARLLPDDASVHSNLATVYAKKADMYADKQMYDLALKEFEKAIELNPEDYVAHNNIGIIYKQKGDIKRAMQEYTEALKLNPNYPLTYNNIGNIYLESAQYDAAIRFYKKAISIDPNKAAFYANMGKAYKNKGMLQKAREAFEKALSIDPNHKDAVDALASFN